MGEYAADLEGDPIREGLVEKADAWSNRKLALAVNSGRGTEAIML